MRTIHTRRGAAALAGGALLCALAAGLAPADAPTAASAASGSSQYPSMAARDLYLMKPDAEIALARSAAPVAISGQATVMVLKERGYETVVKGSNGFTCLVERSWMAPFDNPEFWNPKLRGPVCYNPAASRSVLAYTLRRTELALSGRSRTQLLDDMRAVFARNELPPPEAGAMSFMMSRDQYLGDASGHWHSHLMFHVPKAAAATWGANLAGSPVILDERPVPEPESIFMVPVAHWSDGTAAPLH